MPSAAAISRLSGPGLPAILVAAVLVFPCPSPCETASGGTESVEVAIEHQTFDGAAPYSTSYRAVQDDCTVTWISYYNEPGVVKYQPACPAPLARQLPLLTGICSAFLSRDPNAAAFRTLFWGRLAPDSTPASLEMSFRLATAAVRSNEWDRKRGRPKGGDLNGFARDLANRAMIYPEVKDLFAGFHLTATLSHVEKVLVLEAGRLPFFPELAKAGVGPADLLPFDFMAWFAVDSDPPEENLQDEWTSPQ